MNKTTEDDFHLDGQVNEKKLKLPNHVITNILHLEGVFKS